MKKHDATLLMKKSLFLNILATLIFIFTIASVTPEGSQDRKKSQTGAPVVLDRVVLQLKWFHQFQFAGYYAALDKGFYQTEGLDVTIREGGPGVKIDQIVTNEEANFGVLASELIRIRIQGAPVVLLATIMQHSIRALIIRADAGILSPADLVGLPIMLNRNEDAEFIAMFTGEGIPLEKLQIIEKDNTALKKLIDGKIAAMNGSIGNQPFVLENQGIHVHCIRPISYGVDFYGDSLFTSSQEVREHPERVAAFRRASLRGWEYAMQHTEETIDLILAKYNPRKSRAHLQFEAKAIKNLILPDLVDIGHVNPNRIARIAEVFAEHKIVPAAYSLEGFIYNPDKEIDFVRIQQLMRIIAGLCFLFVFCGAVLLLFNKKLKKTVARRTFELTTANETLKQAMEELRESESRYRGLFEESPISLWEEDFSAVKTHIDGLRDSGISDFRSYFESHPETVRTCAQLVKIIDINGATLKILQVESKEALLENPDKVFGNKSYDAFKEELIYLTAGKYNFELPSFNRTLQGNEIHIILGLTVVPGYEDTWAKVFVSLSDVTKRMKAEAELSEYRNHLEKLVEERTEELKGKTDKIEKSRKALTYLVEDVNASRESLQKVNMEYAAVNTELKEFAYIVSHDLKAPLRAISQLTHWISEDYSESFDADGREQMDLIIKRVKRMDSLIDGILRYSRVGRTREKEERLDLNLLVNEVIENIAPPDNIRITIENELPVVLRDSVRMEQIFQNLIGNAIKYMDKPEGIIQVGCADDGAYWKFSISDNGLGIDKKYHDKIFQIFQALTPRDERESTGVGLSLVKKIIKLYGGSVWVKSEAGCGATFFFTLPKKGGKDENI